MQYSLILFVKSVHIQLYVEDVGTSDLSASHETFLMDFISLVQVRDRLQSAPLTKAFEFDEGGRECDFTSIVTRSCDYSRAVIIINIIIIIGLLF